MAQNTQLRTTFDVSKVIQPIFTRGNVALSQDGGMIATCLEEDVVLTDFHMGEELGRIEGDDEIVTSLALTPTTSHIVICSRSLSMRIYALHFSVADSLVHPKLLRTLKPHSAPVIVTAIDTTGSLLATGGADSIIKIWDIKGGFITHTFHGHSGLVTALHFFQVPLAISKPDTPSKTKKKHKYNQEQPEDEDDSNPGYRLASGGEDGKVRIWDLMKQKSITVLDSHVSVVRKLQYCERENSLLSASRDRTLMVWDTKTWKNRHTIPVMEELETGGFLADGSVIYSGGENGNIRLWSMYDGKELTKSQPPRTETEAILDSICYDSLDFLLTIHADQTLQLHNLNTLDKSEISKSSNRTDPLEIRRRICGNYDQIVDLAYIGVKKDYLAVNSNSEDIRIISLQEKTNDSAKYSEILFGSEVGLLKGHEDIIISMDVDWSGHWLATGAKDNNARIWQLNPDTKEFVCYSVLTGHAESVAAVGLPHAPPPISTPAYTSPLDHPPAFLVTGSDDKTIKRWTIESNSSQKSSKAIFTRKAHEKDINALAVHPSSTCFASASQDKLIKLWSVEDGSTIAVLRGHRRGVWTISFSPTGHQVDGLSQSTKQGYLLSGSGDNTLRVWSLGDYSCLLTLEGHSNSILKVLWLPTPEERLPHDKRGTLVASSSADKLVKVWDLSNGECTSTLDGHSDRVWALITRPSKANSSAANESLISGGADGVITFWKDTSAETAQKARAVEVDRVESEQKLSNLMYGRKYHEAIILALQLDQPGRLLSLFKDVSEMNEPNSYTGSLEVDRVVASLADEQLYRLLLRVRDWNTNSKTAMNAQRILAAIIRSYSRDKIAALQTPRSFIGNGKTAQGIVEILEAIEIWTERHYKRMMELWDESFLLDFVIEEMDGLKDLDTNGDILMLENGD